MPRKGEAPEPEAASWPTAVPLVREPHKAARVGLPQARRAPGPRRADSVALLAEVARLEAEVETLRARVKELEACIDLDPLTEALNRRGFERELERARAYLQRYGGKAALIYLDLDAFKPINDHHGHAAGDAVLKAAATTLQRAVRASDVVARLGGDEFAVLLWNCDLKAALAKAAALEEAIAAVTVDWGGAPLSVKASAGAAELTGRDTDFDVLIRADQAMYARKRASRPRSR